MPLIVTPSAPGTVPAGGTLQFTVEGAGNYTYSIFTNNSGASISASGLYTAGVVFGGVSDTVRITDLNGYSQDVVVPVGASTWTPWGLAACKVWFDTVASAPGTLAGHLTTWADRGPLGTTFIPGAGAVPVTAVDASFNNHPSVTTGSAGSYLKTAATVTLGPFFQVAVLKTAAAGYIAVHNVDGAGNGDFWYTGSPILNVERSGVVQSTLCPTWPALLQNGASHTVTATFDGVAAANTKLDVDGVDQAITPGASGLDLTTVAGTIYLGGNQTGGGNLPATFAAFGAFDGTISPADILNVRFYCKKIFGTP